MFYFFGVTREKELFPNGRFSGCNLMRQSSNPKRDQFIRNIYTTIGEAVLMTNLGQNVHTEYCCIIKEYLIYDSIGIIWDD